MNKVFKVASFEKRLIANLIDLCLLSFLYAIICFGYVAYNLLVFHLTIDQLNLFTFPVYRTSLLLIVLYYMFFESTNKRRTIGKKIMKLMIIDNTDNVPNKRIYLKRVILKIALMASGLSIVFLSMLFTKNKQTLYYNLLKTSLAETIK